MMIHDLLLSDFFSTVFASKEIATGTPVRLKFSRSLFSKKSSVCCLNVLWITTKKQNVDRVRAPE